jgi:hypothetical protein
VFSWYKGYKGGERGSGLSSAESLIKSAAVICQAKNENKNSPWLKVIF